MQEAAAEQPPAGIPMIRTIAMPADSNANGDIFGGWIMSQMDLAAGNLAARVSHGRCVTVSADAMSFLRPVKIGDEVSVYCELVSTGRTSMKIAVEAWRRARITEEEYRVTRATFTFVAIDAEGRPRAIRGAGILTPPTSSWSGLTRPSTPYFPAPVSTLATTLG